MPFKSITLIPGADLAEKRYHFVTVNAGGKGVVAGAGVKAVGVLQEPNNIDQPAQVMVSGVSFVKLGGIVAAGDPISIDADGKAVKTVTTATVVGVALVGGAAGAIGSVLI